MRGDSFLGDERERGEHRDALDEGELRGGSDVRIDLDQPSVSDEDEHGENRADHQECRLEPYQAQNGRRDERADRRRAHRQAPRHAEHAGQHLVGDGALEEREPRDVDDAVRSADHREQEDHGQAIGKRRDQHDRHSPEDERPGEGRREPLAAQRDRAERADQASGTDRGRQVSDLRCPSVEHLVGDDDDEDVQAPAYERLRGDEADEQPRARDLPDCREALPDLDSTSCSQVQGRRPGTDTRASRPAETRRAAAPTAKTAATSANATSTPAASGPSRVPRLSIVEVAPLAAISSRAVRASDGSSDMRAGRKSVEESRPRIRRRRRRCDRPSAAPTAETSESRRAQRARLPSRKRSRRKRSPREDANGAIAAAGSKRMRPAIPTAVDPPWLYANTPSATKCAHSAEIDAPQASSARRTSTF